jgi:hypothetical protein
MHRWYFQENDVTRSRGQMRNVHFLEMALLVARIALLFGIQQSSMSYRNVDGVSSMGEHVRCIFENIGDCWCQIQ